jgi:hypothetical protein
MTTPSDFKSNVIYNVTYPLGNRTKREKLRFRGISEGGTCAVFSFLFDEKKTMAIPMKNITQREVAQPA